MAFFKFRWLTRTTPDDKPGRRGRVPQAESIEVMRRRARHRLMGAAVLVGLGVIGFPVLFDTQPRPIPADIPIDIPDRNKVAPLAVPSSGAGGVSLSASRVSASAAASSAAGRATGSASVSPPAGILDGEEVISSASTARASQPAVTTAASPGPREAGKPSMPPVSGVTPNTAPESARSSRPDDGQRARALLEGKGAESGSPSTGAAAQEGRYVVQVGAFGDMEKVREVRARLERAGLKTYTHAIDTKEGKRVRVRVGPFSSKAEAERAAMRVKSLDLPVSVLTL